MRQEVVEVLFLSTANSARSIFAESLVERLGMGKFNGFSADCHPRGEIAPYAISGQREKG